MLNKKLPFQPLAARKPPRWLLLSCILFLMGTFIVLWYALW